MFEPLSNLLEEHANRMNDSLDEIRSHLLQIVQNTQGHFVTQSFIDQAAITNTGEGTTGEIEFHTKEGYFWKVFQTAITGSKEGSCAVYLHGINPDSLIDVISPSGIAKSTAEYLVPPRSKLFFHFYEQPKNQTCTVHMQIERLIIPPTYEVQGFHSQEKTTPDIQLDGHRHLVPRVPVGHGYEQ